MKFLTIQSLSFLFQILICVLITNVSNAQVLVADINQTGQGSNPEYMDSNGSQLAFFANGDDGKALYGLAVGENEPQLLYNLSLAQQGEFIWDSKLVDDDMYFVTHESSVAYFHRTNLSTGNTVVFLEVPTNGLSSQSIGKFTQLGNLVYFIYRNPNYQFQIWKTDGSVNGTQLVSTLSDNNAFPQQFIAFNNELYFTLLNDQAKGEIWKTDGNTLQLLIDIDPNNNPDNYGVFNFTVFNNRLYFDTFSPDFGHEVWSTDGTTSGTELFKDFLPGSEGFGSQVKGVVGNQLFLSAVDPALGTELHVSDGTVAGTQVYVDMEPGSEGAFIGNIVGSENIIYGSRYSLVSGRELWRTDGTPSGTFLLKDIHPGIESSLGSNFISQLIGDVLFFIAENESNGLEIWRTDGTTAGTTLWSDIYPGITGSSVENLQFFDNQLYFNGDHPEFGNELWANDISVSDPQLVADLFTFSSASSFPNLFNEINGTLYFRATTGCSGFELFRTEGTAISTLLIKDAFPGQESSYPSNVVSLQNHLYFTAESSTFETRIWKSDGTESGTNFIAELEGVPTVFGGLGAPVVLNDKIIIRDYVQGFGQCIIDIDPTTEAAQVVKVINPNFGLNSSGNTFFPLNSSELVFVDKDTINGFELWRTDGTENGTYMVKNILPDPSNSIHVGLITPINGIAYFRAGDFGGQRLWRSDGTELGTYPISNTSSGRPNEIIEFNNEIYFVTWSSGEYKLMKTDGSLSNTQVAPYTGLNPNFSVLRSLRVYNNRLYFIGNTYATGEEVWFYDPNTQSFELLKDIYPGSEGTIRDLTVGDSLLYFAADDGIHGLEFWKSDGTTDETEMVADMWQGQEGSNPGNFYPYQNFIYFDANEGGEFGTELYKYSPLDQDNDGYLPPEDMDDTDPNVNVDTPNDPSDVFAFCGSDSTNVNTNEIEWKKDVKIYPNPATNFIQIELPVMGAYMISIEDVLGRPIAASSPSGQTARFDVEQLIRGTYFVRIRDLSNKSNAVWKVLIL